MNDGPNAGVPPPLPPLAAEVRRRQAQLLAWAVVGVALVLGTTVARGTVQVGLWGALGLVLVAVGATYLRLRRTMTDMIRSASGRADGTRPPAISSLDTAAGTSRRVFQDRTLRRQATAMTVLALVTLPVLVDDWSRLTAGSFLLPASVVVLALVPALRVRRMRVEAHDDGLHLVGFLRTRHVPWTRIVGAGLNGSGLTVLLDDDRVVRSIASGTVPWRPHVGPLLDAIHQRASGQGHPR